MYDCSYSCLHDYLRIVFQVYKKIDYRSSKFFIENQAEHFILYHLHNDSIQIGLLLYTSGPVSLKERLLYTLNKLFVKQVKSFLLLLDLDPFILQCSLHNIKYIKFTSP